MMLLHTPAALQAPADTVVAVMTRGPLAVATDVAVLVMALGIAVLSVLGIVVLRRVDRSTRRLRKQVESSLGPVSDRAGAISDNIAFITEVLRTDVQKLHGSVQALGDRLEQASDRMEERIEEFNALMEVVQDEAEDIFIDTASTVRGVREGARAMTGVPPGTRAEDGEEGGRLPGADPAGHERPPEEEPEPPPAP